MGFRYFLILGCLILLLANESWDLRVQAPAKKEPASKEPAKKEVPNKETPKDPLPKENATLKFPSGAIVVVTGGVMDAIPKDGSIVLSPEKYKELADRLEQLQALLDAQKTIRPRSCELEGKVEQRGTRFVIRWKAAFKYTTTVPRSLVQLGCQKAQLVEAKTEDGKLPVLTAGENGLVVQVETPGDYLLRLELESPLLVRAPKGNGVGIDIGLPGAPITILSLEPAAKVRQLTLGIRTLRGETSTDVETETSEMERFAPGKNGVPLGAVTFLTLTWDDPNQKVEAPRSVEADQVITLSENEAVAESQLRLRGTTKEWRFLAPATAEVSVTRSVPPGSAKNLAEFPPDQAPTVARPEPGQNTWRIQFREATSVDMLVTILARTPRPKTTDPKGKWTYPVGPFAVLDIPQQSGTIRVKAPTHLRVTANLKGETRRPENEDPNGDLLFRYGSLPGNSNQPTPPLELEIRPSLGTIQTRTRHFLQLSEGGWRIRTEFQVTPIRTEVDSLEIEAPIELQQAVALPKELVEGVAVARESGPRRRIFPIKLIAPKRLPFTLVLEGIYPHAPSLRETNLFLPRPLNVFDRDPEVAVAVPDGYELRGGVREWENDRPGNWVQPLEPARGTERGNALTASPGRAAAQVDLSWRPLRDDYRVESTIEMNLGERQARFRQKLQFHLGEQTARRIRLKGSPQIVGLSVNVGSVDSLGNGAWDLLLPPELGKDTTCIVSYATSLPSGRTMGTRWKLPLLFPQEASVTTAQLRIWQETPQREIPIFVSGPWENTPPEIIPEKNSLPLLSIQTFAFTESPEIQFQESASLMESSVRADRVLIQTQSFDLDQRYRARFHLNQWLAGNVDIEMPTGAIDIETWIQGKQVEWREAPDSKESQRVIRLPFPAQNQMRSLMLELRYRLNRTSRWSQDYQAPQPRFLTIQSIRWLIGLPQGTIPLHFGTATVEERWGVQGFLPGPRGSRSAMELERWLQAGLEPEDSISPWDVGEAPWSVRSKSSDPVYLVHLPRSIWIIGGSSLIFLVGLALYWLPSQARVLVLLGLVLLGLLGAFLFPQPMQQALSAILPGVVLLLLLFACIRFLQWQYRRRLDRIPSFVRKANSSFTMGNNGPSGVRPPNRETSTIDSPSGPPRLEGGRSSTNKPEPWATP